MLDHQFHLSKNERIAASSFHPSVGSRHELARRTSRKSLGPHTLNSKLITKQSQLTALIPGKKNWTIWYMCCCSKVLSQKIVELEENNKKASARAQCSRWIVLSQFFTKKSQESYGYGVVTAAPNRHLPHFWPAKQQMVAAKWSTCPTFGCSECRLAVLKIPSKWFTVYL